MNLIRIRKVDELMNYISYNEYVELGGTVDESTFNRLIIDVESKLNYLTNGRLAKLEEVPVAVKKLIVKLIAVYKDADGNTNAIASYSNGIESFSYKVDDDSSKGSTSSDKKIYSIVKEYLWECPELLYRGIDK